MNLPKMQLHIYGYHCGNTVCPSLRNLHCKCYIIRGVSKAFFLLIFFWVYGGVGVWGCLLVIEPREFWILCQHSMSKRNLQSCFIFYFQKGLIKLFKLITWIPSYSRQSVKLFSNAWASWTAKILGLFQQIQSNSLS